MLEINGSRVAAEFSLCSSAGSADESEAVIGSTPRSQKVL